MWNRWYKYIEDSAMSLSEMNQGSTSLQSETNIKKPKSSVLWTESDSKEVKRLMSEGKLISDIAQLIGRTEESIAAKMKMWKDKGQAEIPIKPESKESNKPANAGKSWKYDDDSKVRELIKAGDKQEKIAALMNRTLGSINARVKKYAYDDITSGKDETETLKLYSLDKVMYDRFAKTKTKKKEDKKSITKKDNKIASQVDLTPIITKLDTLTQLVTLCLKNQEDHFKRINQIWEHCTQ